MSKTSLTFSLDRSMYCLMSEACRLLAQTSVHGILG
nr:MAG TPA: hypothetical protein [Caudoviricetes sp.]